MPSGEGAGSRRSRNARGEGDRLREEIIAAALGVLSALGPEDPFSLRAVAKAAEIAAPSVYLHFPDRDALLLAVLAKLFDEQVALRDRAEAAAVTAGGGAWEGLLARSIAAVEFGLANPGHYRALFEGRVVPRLEDPRAAAFGAPLLARSVALIAEIEAAGPRVTENPAELALLLWSGLHGIVSLRINKPTIDWSPAAEAAEQMARAIIRPSR